MKTRLKWVDYYKAIAIILIVIAHTTGVLGKYIQNFHVAIFFVISGFLFKCSDESFVSYLKRKWKSLMVPFIKFTCILTVIAIILSKLGTYFYSGEVYSSDDTFYFVKANDYSKTAYEIAFELRPHLRDLYTLNMTTNTYEYDTSDIRAAIEQNGFYKGFDGTFIIGLDDKKQPLVDINNNPDNLPF